MAPLSPTVELYLGPTLGWVDITAARDVRLGSASSGGGITITRGRQNEAGDLDPGQAHLVLNNRHGNYSPRNPTSDYYGALGRNTPIRIRLAQADPGTAVALPGRVYASGDPGPRITTPYHASFGITGDLDVRLWGRHPGMWRAPVGMLLAGRYDPGGNQRSWWLAIGASGKLRFAWTTDGITGGLSYKESTVAVSPFTGGVLAVRAALDVDNGASGWTLRFYTSDDIAGPWTQLGDDVTGAGTTSVFAGTDRLEIAGEGNIGGDSFGGELYGFQLLNGISGTPVASPDFTSMEIGDTVLTDAQGRVYTLDAGALVVDRGARLYGEVSSWPARWDLSGNDVWVPIQAAGITRRLGQGSSPVRSPLYRMLLATNPAAYLPLEDGAGATRPTSAAVGVPAGTSELVTYAADTTLAGAATVVRMDSPSSRITTSVAARTTTTWGWMVLFKLDAMPSGGDVTYMRVRMYGGTVVQWDLQVSSVGYRWIGYNSSGTAVADQALLHSTAVPTGWIAMAMRVQQSGGTVNWGPAYHAIGTTVFLAGTGGYNAYSYAGTVGTVASVELLGSTYTEGGWFAHLVVDDAEIPLLTPAFAPVSTGYAGETAGQRMYRLAAEQGVPMVFGGPPLYTEKMGVQGAGTFLDLMRECADVDGGILSECRGQVGLTYRPRNTLYNQEPLALSYTGGHISPPFDPIDDDQAVRNHVTVTREGGGSATAVDETGPMSTQDPPGGVGTYDTQVTLKLYEDDQCADQAHWRVHLGTVDEARWPRIRADLRSSAWAADAELTSRAALLDSGDMLQLEDLPAWLPPGPTSALVQGYTEMIDAFEWGITWNATPGSPWSVFTVADPDLGRVDTGGSELASSATSSTPTLAVATTDGPIWVPDPTHWPFDVTVGGERCTVTGIGANQISNSGFEVDTSGWSTSSGTLTRSTARAYAGAGSALFVPNGSSASASISMTSAVQVPVTPGQVWLAQVWLYADAGYADAAPAIDWYTSGSVFISTSLTGSLAISAGVWTLRNLSYTAPAGAAFARLRAVRLGGTAPSSLSIWIDQARLLLASTALASPQSLEVIRSVNGAVMSHAAGTQVSLWKPAVIAL